MMMIAANSLVCQKEGVREEEEEETGGRGKEGPTGTHARRGRSHRFNSVRGVGCEEQEKTYKQWCGIPLHRKGRGGGLEISPILSR